MTSLTCVLCAVCAAHRPRICCLRWRSRLLASCAVFIHRPATVHPASASGESLALTPKQRTPARLTHCRQEQQLTVAVMYHHQQQQQQQRQNQSMQRWVSQLLLPQLAYIYMTPTHTATHLLPPAVHHHPACTQYFTPASAARLQERLELLRTARTALQELPPGWQVATFRRGVGAKELPAWWDGPTHDLAIVQGVLRHGYGNWAAMAQVRRHRFVRAALAGGRAEPCIALAIAAPWTHARCVAALHPPQHLSPRMSPCRSSSAPGWHARMWTVPPTALLLLLMT